MAEVHNLAAATTLLGRAAAAPAGQAALTLVLRETPGNLSGSGSELMSIFRQPVPIATSRCYLIQML
jgi:hypothetical protein